MEETDEGSARPSTELVKKTSEPMIDLLDSWISATPALMYQCTDEWHTQLQGHSSHSLHEVSVVHAFPMVCVFTAEDIALVGKAAVQFVRISRHRRLVFNPDAFTDHCLLRERMRKKDGAVIIALGPYVFITNTSQG